MIFKEEDYQNPGEYVGVAWGVATRIADYQP